MIISRHIFIVKERRLEEAMEHARWWWREPFPPPHGHRLYTPIEDGSSSVLVADEEFESPAEWESHGDRVHSSPDFEAAIERWRELADIQHELFQVLASG